MVDAGGEDHALSELLDGELAFDATTSTHLTNHLPMALVALHRLGAPDDRLVEFAAAYKDRLAPIPLDQGISTFDEWRSARGRRGAYGPLRVYFEARIATDGLDATVRRHLPLLIDGLAGAAFHGLIRLAYALESASDRRVAAGLAYLSEVHTPLGDRGRAVAWTSEPLVALRRLSDVEVLGRLARTGNIGQKMRQVAAHPSFSGVADWLEMGENTAELLTRAAAALFAATDDFTALHGVTASHAALVVAPYVEDTSSLCTWWFQGIAAAYVTIGAPRLSDPGRGLEPWLAAPPVWGDVVAAATSSDDEHVTKIVYSARELGERFHDPLLLAAAARHAGVAPALS